jgi:hypothetical protein
MRDAWKDTGMLREGATIQGQPKLPAPMLRQKRLNRINAAFSSSANASMKHLPKNLYL